MSRIGGVKVTAATERGATLVEWMLGALSSGPEWKLESAAAGPTTLGWCGWDEVNLAVVDGIIAVMDGRVYNREDLGVANNDAALVVVLYSRHGWEGAIQRLNGDFAAALYDPRDDTLWLARDRFGVKPLYYVARAGHFAFASRPRALLALPGVPRDVNRRFAALFAASHYRYFDNHLDESPFAAIAQLPPAHTLRLANGRVTIRRYWALEDSPDLDAPAEALAVRYRELLTDSVAIRLRRAPRPAFTLSGGMDSASVLGVATHLTGIKQSAFSSVYADKTYDESDEIRAMREAAVERWHAVRVDSPDVLALVRRMVETHDEPVATATWLSHLMVAEAAAAEGFRSLFGGLGGDELNAGEYEHFLYHFADLRAAGQEDRLDREIQMWARHHDHPVFRKNRDAVERHFARLVDFGRPGRCLLDRARFSRYASALRVDWFDLAGFEPVMEHRFASYLKNRTYQDLTRETVPCCLRAEDRQTSVFGLDHFLPFLDHRLVELMFRVSGGLKIRDGVTKILLREAMRGMLPEETRTRVKKTGWNAPAHLWFSGPGRELLLDLVHTRAFRERGLYDVARVVELIQEHAEIVASGRPVENHMMFLWQLVNLELWHEWLRELKPPPPPRATGRSLLTS